MDDAGAPRAHIVGHSYGGLITLQLALGAPDRVHSVALLEAAITSVPSIQPMMDGMVAMAGLHQQARELRARQKRVTCNESEEFIELSGIASGALLAFRVGRARLFWPGEDPGAQGWLASLRCHAME
jgi:pimeloyl-ACP methyl ester carboxylesterase